MQELDGRQLRVNSGPPPQRETSFSRSPQRETSFSRGPGARGGETFDSGNRVYVGNLSWNVDDSALETLFREKGKVMDAKVIYDRDSGRSKGFGFVSYSSAEEAEDAVDSLNGAVSISFPFFLKICYIL